MKVTNKGRVTIPPAMSKKHGLQPQCDVGFIDEHSGVLIVKVGKLSRGKMVVAALLRAAR
jgi:bifunctional DNA-binding transcriptional regulator/antitoxin component of YhaV-PrlF toxin-antitoxin module